MKITSSLLIILVSLAARLETVAVSYYSTSDDGTRLVIIDTDTAATTPFAPHGQGQAWAAAFDNSNGRLYGLYNGFSGAQLGEFNLSTGTLNPIGPTGVNELISLEIANDGNGYGIGAFDQILYRVNMITGVATPVGPTGINFTMDLAFDSAGDLFATSGGQMWKVDTTTGTATPVFFFSGAGGLENIMGISFDSSGRLFATVYESNGRLLEVNPGTGSVLSSSPTDLFLPHGGDILAAAVPDIGSSSALLLIGMAGLAFVRRKCHQ